MTSYFFIFSPSQWHGCVWSFVGPEVWEVPHAVGRSSQECTVHGFLSQRVRTTVAPCPSGVHNRNYIMWKFSWLLLCWLLRCLSLVFFLSLLSLSLSLSLSATMWPLEVMITQWMCGTWGERASSTRLLLTPTLSHSSNFNVSRFLLYHTITMIRELLV